MINTEINQNNKRNGASSETDGASQKSNGSGEEESQRGKEKKGAEPTAGQISTKHFIAVRKSG